MEIQDAAYGYQGDSKSADILETNLVIRGKMPNGTYQNISYIPRASPKADIYDEIPDIVTDLPSLQDGEVDISPRDVSPSTARHNNGRKNGNPTYDNNIVWGTPNKNSSYRNDRKLISIMKAADETVIMDNDIYEGSDSGGCD